MKRSSSLESLSHDHYAGLQLAARIRRACETEGEVLSLVADIQKFRVDELRPHFAAETTILLPLLKNIEPTYASRMVSEHEALNALVDKLSNDTVDRKDELCNFGTLLAAHIRFEETPYRFAIEEAPIGRTVGRACVATAAEDLALNAEGPAPSNASDVPTLFNSVLRPGPRLLTCIPFRCRIVITLAG